MGVAKIKGSNMSNVTSSTSSTPVSSLPAPDGTTRAETRTPEVDLLVLKQKEIETVLGDISRSSDGLQNLREGIETSWARFKSDPNDTNRQLLDRSISLAKVEMDMARRRDEAFRGTASDPTPPILRNTSPESRRATFVEVLTTELARLSKQDQTLENEVQALLIGRELKVLERHGLNEVVLQRVEAMVIDIQSAQKKRSDEQFRSQFDPSSASHSRATHWLAQAAPLQSPGKRLSPLPGTVRFNALLSQRCSMPCAGSWALRCFRSYYMTPIPSNGSTAAAAAHFAPASPAKVDETQVNRMVAKALEIDKQLKEMSSLTDAVREVKTGIKTAWADFLLKKDTESMRVLEEALDRAKVVLDSASQGNDSPQNAALTDEELPKSGVQPANASGLSEAELKLAQDVIEAEARKQRANEALELAISPRASAAADRESRIKNM